MVQTEIFVLIVFIEFKISCGPINKYFFDRIRKDKSFLLFLTYIPCLNNQIKTLSQFVLVNHFL